MSWSITGVVFLQSPKNTQQTTVVGPFSQLLKWEQVFFWALKQASKSMIVLRDFPEKNLGGCHIDRMIRVKEGTYVCCKFEIIKTNTLQGTNISTTKALLSP